MNHCSRNELTKSCHSYIYAYIFVAYNTNHDINDINVKFARLRLLFMPNNIQF